MLRENFVYAHWKDVPVAEFKARWPSFSPQELASKGTVANGAGKVMLNFRALDMLQALRNKLGRPLILNSAYRTPEHNRAVGGAKNSNHMQAIAYDVRMDNHNPEAFERAAVEVGFRGIGHYPSSNFMHVDARQTSTVVRFKGTGANNRWFFSGTPSLGSKAEATPDFNQPAPPRTLDTVKELAPILGPAVIGPAVALGNGDGPVQWAVGAVILLVALAGLIHLIKKRKQSREGDNA